MNQYSYKQAASPNSSYEYHTQARSHQFIVIAVEGQEEDQLTVVVEEVGNAEVATAAPSRRRCG
jgi:hypothetical protein